MCVCVCVCVCVCLSVCMSVCVLVCIARERLCMYVCMYVHVCVEAQLKDEQEQRRGGVAVVPGGVGGDGEWGTGGDGKKIWISHAEQKRLEVYERQLAARVTDLTQRAGDGIAVNVELRREIDEMRREYVMLNSEATALEHGRATICYMIEQHEQVCQ